MKNSKRKRIACFRAISALSGCRNAVVIGVIFVAHAYEPKNHGSHKTNKQKSCKRRFHNSFSIAECRAKYKKPGARAAGFKFVRALEQQRAYLDVLCVLNCKELASILCPAGGFGGKGKEYNHCHGCREAPCRRSR